VSCTWWGGNSTVHPFTLLSVFIHCKPNRTFVKSYWSIPGAAGYPNFIVYYAGIPFWSFRFCPQCPIIWDRMDAIFEGVAPRCIHESTSRLGLTRDLGTGRLDWRDPIFICDGRYRLKFVAFVPSIRAPACFSLAVSDDARASV
jgi:hypothetical protein